MLLEKLEQLNMQNRTSIRKEVKQMTKEELAESIADCCCSKKEASDCVDAIIDTITKSLQKGEEVRFTGFGTFKVSERKARKGRNPRTGETIQISARKVPSFKAGKGLKDAVN